MSEIELFDVVRENWCLGSTDQVGFFIEVERMYTSSQFQGRKAKKQSNFQYQIKKKCRL